MAPKHHPTPLSGGDRKALNKELGNARAMTTILARQSAECRAEGEATIREACVLQRPPGRACLHGRRQGYRHAAFRLKAGGRFGKANLLLIATRSYVFYLSASAGLLDVRGWQRHHRRRIRRSRERS